MSFERFLYIVIGVLLIVILVQQCSLSKYKNKSQGTVVKTDTITKVDTLYVTREIASSTIPQQIGQSDQTNIVYQADTNYNHLKDQYNMLMRDFLSIRYFADTLKIDSSTIATLDTVTKGKIQGRRWKVDLKQSVVTKTTTITNTVKEPSRNQVYMGGEVNLSPDQDFTSINLGLLYKTKGDFIVQGKVGTTTKGNLTYGGGLYWKIKLKK